MKVSFYWSNKLSSVLVYQFEHGWTIDSFYQGVEASCDELRGKQERVDIIVDFSQDANFPDNILSAAYAILKDAPQTIGAIVLVSGGRSIISEMLNLFLRRYPDMRDKFTLATTVSAALDVISKSRDMLSP